MNRIVSSIDPLVDLQDEAIPHDSSDFRAFLSSLLAGAARMDTYGRDPHDEAPPFKAEPGTPEYYAPEYVALLYLHLGSGWDIQVNHACYAVPAGNDETARRIKAVAVLGEKVLRNVEFGDSAMLHHNPYQHQLIDVGHQPSHDFDSRAFTDFKFKSQNETFIFIHHPGMAITLAENALFAFKVTGSDGMPRNQNFSFYHARVVPQAEMGMLAGVGSLLRVENHQLKEDGKRLGLGESRAYGLDILFGVDGGDAGQITLIIDPDTGNGSGYEP